jgi:hypothetical protein
MLSPVFDGVVTAESGESDISSALFPRVAVTHNLQPTHDRDSGRVVPFSQS